MKPKSLPWRTSIMEGKIGVSETTRPSDTLSPQRGPRRAKRESLIGKPSCGGLGKPLGRGEGWAGQYRDDHGQCAEAPEITRPRPTLLAAWLSLLLLTLPATVQAQFTFTTNSDGSLNISQYSGVDSSITIPATSYGLPVTSIGQLAFAGHTNLASVTIPASVTSIGDFAFSGCSNLASLTISGNVTNLGESIFQGCIGLSSVTMPNQSVIGEFMFQNCTSLTNLAIPAGVTSIEDSAFQLCANLTIASLPGSLTNIGSQSFYGCSNLVNITIPGGVAYIGDQSFEYCTSLTNATIGSGVASIGTETFFDCTSLTTAAIPDTVTSIGYAAFGRCFGLTSITIPNSVTNIEQYAYDDCTNLTNVYFEGNAPTADATVFYVDNNVTVYYSQGTTGWSSTFAAVPTALLGPFNYVTNSGAITITGYTGNDSVLIIPPEINGLPVTSIADEAFAGSFSAASVTIPDSVTNLGEDIFDDCIFITNFTVDASNPAFSSTNGVLFDKDQTKLIQFPAGLGGAYIIPNGVTSIGDYAFNYCELLTSVSIPDTVTNIGNLSFQFAYNLESLILPNSVTSIGEGAFYACAGYTNALILPNLTDIQGAAFADNPSLPSVDIPAGVTNIETYAFAGCLNLKSVFFHGNAPATNSNVFADGTNATLYYLPGTTGWSNSFDGRPAVLWNPTIQTANGQFGVQNNQFGFTITGTVNIPIVVEACANLANPVWVPVQTCTVTNGSIYFRDPQSSNFPDRYYRISSQ